MDTVLKEGSRKGRPNYSRSFKLKVAIAACAPDISISKLALSHQINANMIFKWRREYRAGRLSTADTDTSTLLPVVVVAPQDAPPVAVTPPRSAPRDTHGSIVIEIADAVVHVDGTVDAAMLRMVIASLRA